MLGATFFMKGSVCDVPVQLDFQVQGAAKSIVLTCQAPVSLTDAWRELGKALDKIAGFGLPDIPDGPWKLIFDAELTLSAWLTAGDAGGRGMSAYVGMDFISPIHIGGTKSWGAVSITLEPNIAIEGVYIGYDPQQGGVDIRCKVLTPTTPGGSPDSLAEGSPTAPFAKMVSFPPPVPAQNSLSTFKLKYLGIGQRVGPEVVIHGDDPMAEIFHTLETQLTGNDPREILTRLAKTFYHPDRDWFIAAHLLMRGWDLKVLFNDPTMYGLEIMAPVTSPPDFFSGFLFEILYQKLGPNLGVYFGRIDLPTNLRRIPLEGFILILPNFSAWIYTNGDFRINVGWPIGDNSIGIQMDVLIGRGGFYFARLRSGDDPGALPSVNYNPILAFGIGMSISASVGADAGVLSASLSVSVSATLQGLIAWKATDGGGTRSIANIPDHYWFAGSAGLAILLQGSVNFVVIKASVSVSLTANVDVAFETGYSSLIAASATVDVSASVKVVFFTIHFHFSAHISHSFTIGSGPHASPDGPLAPGLSVVVPKMLEADGMLAEVLDAIAYSRATLPAGALDAASIMALSPRFASVLPRGPRLMARASGVASPAPAGTIDLYFALLPTILYGASSPAPGETVELIATLVAEAPPPGGSPLPSPEAATGFERIVVELVTWLLTFVPATSPADPLSVRLAALADILGHGAQEPGAPFAGADGFTDAVRGFLADTFVFNIVPVAPGSPALPQSMAVLPMFDVLALDTPVSPGHVDFGTFNPVPANYRAAVDVYYADLGLLGGTPPMAKELLADATLRSMATTLLGDFFLMLARKVVDDLAKSAAVYEKEQAKALPGLIASARLSAARLLAVHRAITDHVAATDPAVELAKLIDSYDFASASGLCSRFMLGGLQLPDPSQIPAVITPETMRAVPTESLYRLSGQAFSGVTPGSTVEATLRIAGGGTLDWIHLPAGSPAGAIAAFDVPATLPGNPDPVWHVSASPGSPGPIAPGEIVLRPLPTVSGAPLALILKQQIAWASPSGALTLYPLPQPVTDMVRARGSLKLALSERTPAGSPPASPASPPMPASGQAGLLIRLTVSQIPAAGGGSVPYVYQVGGTDEETRDLIYRALQEADFSAAAITLLYSKPGETGFISDTLSAGVLLARTNLSTDNQASQTGTLQMLRMVGGPSAGTHSALLSDPAGFLRLIWEVSVVQATGYGLYYRTAAGAGLPAELFADTAQTTGSPDAAQTGVVAGTSGQTAPFAILVTFSGAADPVSLAPFENYIVAATGSPSVALGAKVLDASGAPVLSYSQSLPTGYAGFAVEWAQGTDSPDAPIPVEHLYNLIQYAVSGTGFLSSDWSLPVGPTGSGDGSPGAPWRYQQTLPLYRFLAAGSPHGSPAPNASPYGIVGASPSLSFRLIDLFGNPLPDSHGLSLAPLYTDPLSGPGDWPGVESSYYVSPLSGDAAAALTLTLAFHLDSLQPPSGSPGDASLYWTALADRYAGFALQMADPGTHVALEASLMAGGSPVPDGSPDAKSVLAAFTASIAAMLADIAKTGTLPSPGLISTTLEGVVQFSDIIALSHNVVEVEVALKLWRDPDMVDAETRARIPASVSLSAAVQPDWSGFQAPSKGRLKASGSRNFAQGFEAAFTDFAGPGSKLKLAQRSGVGSGAGAGQVPDLWAVRFSESAGIDISFHPKSSPGFSPGRAPVFFALAPLATSAMSDTVDGITYSGIDIDAWARDYLRVLDSLLSAETGTALAILDERYGTTHFEDLLEVKTKLAKGVVKAVTQVLSEQSGMGDVSAAQERLTQAMLTALDSAYSVSTLVQVPAEVTVVGGADGDSPQMAPQFYGTLGPASTGSGIAQPFSLSAATLDVEGPATQWVTALLTVAQPQMDRSIQLPLDFTISYMQHDFLVDEEYEGIIPSSWLKFVLPGDAVLSHVIAASPGIEIPVPLPFDPPLPVLQAQAGAGAALPSPIPPSSPNAVRKEIEDALKWAYVADLSLDIAGQDQLYLDLTFNGTGEAASPGGFADTAHLKTLFQALARFRTLWSTVGGQIAALLREAYPDLGSPPLHSPNANPSPASPDPRDLLPALVATAQDVATAWTEDVFALRLAPEPGAEILHFILERNLSQFSPDMAQVRLFAAVDGSGVPALWPELSNQDGSLRYIPDPAQAVPQPDGWYRIDMTVSAALDFGQLRLTFGPLDLTRRRSGDLTAWVVRNADLIDGATTNPAFVYVSPKVSFKSPTIPIITRPSLTPILLEGFTLVEVLTDILAPLMAMSADFEPNLTFVAGWSAALTQTATGESLRVATPISLVNDAALASGASGAGLAREIAQGIWDWYVALRPPSLAPRLDLALTLFGTIDDERLPFFQVGDIPILVSDITLLNPAAG